MVFLADNEFCINCGVSKNRIQAQSDCNHVFKKCIEFFIPSIELYGKEKIDWVLYTVNDEKQSVYIDSADFTGPRQKVGTGGIALRNLRLVYKNYLLNDLKIFTVLKEQLKIDDKQAKEVLRLLSYLEELYRNVDIYVLNDFNFKENAPYPSLKIEDSPLMQFLDISGTVKYAEMFKDIQVHGQWGAKNLEA